MNHFRQPPDIDPFASALDAVMADIAISVQLPPGLHAKAGGRYEAIREFAERPGTPLNGRILRFYPQGSMAIDATTSTRGTDDEYDLDIVAALDLDPHADPDEVLDLLYRSLEGYPTGQKVERQTRCVTVRYADRMHVDVTPAVRLGHGAERVSHIFHAHPDKPASEHFHVPMNAYGFAEWYRARTPLERRFAAAFNKRLHEAYGMEVRADAEVDEILDQVPIIVKAVATVALQLLKRHRNVAYAGATGRIPPSVMLSCFAGQASQPGLPLTDMVIRLARTVASALRAASARRQRIKVVNPVHLEDCFTDRWPENLAQQDAYAAKLTDLADGLPWIKQHGSSLEDIQDWLRERFGSHVVSTSVRRFNDRTGRAVQTGLHAYTPRGGLYVPSRPALVGVGGAAAAAPARASAHTFRGGRRW